MDVRYSDWIDENVSLDGNDVYGKCSHYSLEMREVFPELFIRKGFYICPVWGMREHYWLETKQGDVVDPTKKQFPSNGSGEYKSLEEDELPIGKCLNCNCYIFEGGFSSNLCSKECEIEMIASLK